MKSERTNFILPAELVDIRLFVEVVTILTDVVQLQVKHIFVGSCQLEPDLEFVKSFTPVKFQKFSILPDKNAYIETLWSGGELRIIHCLTWIQRFANIES